MSKKKWSKRFTASVLTIMMAVTMVPADMVKAAGIKEAQAISAEKKEVSEVRTAGDTGEENGFQYKELEDGTVAVERYTGAEAEVEIPAELGGKKVTLILNYAFQFAVNEGENITSITIPETVTTIGEAAMGGCDNLVNIIVNSDNKTYTSEKGLLYNKEKTELIWCPKGKQGVVSIETGVMNIRNLAFNFCDNLTGIIIPETVTYIESNAFLGLSKLESITADNNKKYIVEDGILYDKEKTELLICCPGEKKKSVLIARGVTKIDSGAFYKCSTLTSVTIPETVTSIGSSAFYGCGNIKNVYYGGSETEWKNIEIYYQNDNLLNATMHYKSCLHPSFSRVNEKAATCTVNGYTGDKVCASCGTVVEKGTVISAPGHKAVKDPAKAATCTKSGKTEGSHCSVCNTVLEKQKTIKPSHTYKTVKVNKKATTKKNGSLTKKCTRCGKTTKETIYYAKSIKLSKTSVTYNGKSQKPSVSIKDSKGKKISSKYYSVSYKNNKNVGVATVTIKFKGNYSGTVTKTFKIVPKATSISTVSAKSKAFSVKWKKQSSQTTGYMIRYSTSSKFKGAKTVTIDKNKITSKTISKLKAKKKYYVRVCTYKKVKVNGKYTKICSDWSKVKTVKTK